MIISKQLSGGTSAPTISLEVTAKSSDITNNRTQVQYTLKIERPYAISSSASKNYSVKIGAKTITGTTVIGGTGTKTIATGTTYVDHNADGTKIVNCSFSIAVEITWSGVYNGTISESGNMTLPTIPRGTVPTVPTSATLGDAIQITLPRHSSTFTHTVKYSIGSASGTIAENAGVSANWSIPVSLANQITEGTSGKCKITVTTYSIDDLVGTETAYITLKVPTSIVPSITGVTARESALTGFTRYIQYKSKIGVTVTAKGAYGSTIKSVVSKLDGIIYNGATFTTDLLQFSGNKNLTTTVTDSRGRTQTVNTSITVVPYTIPKINTFEVYRCDASGNVSDSGTNLKIVYDYSILSLYNENTKSIVISYESESAFGQITTLTDYEASGTYITDASYSADISYNIKLSIADKFSEVNAVRTVDTDATTFDIHFSGQGMALGKVSETQDLFDVNWNARFRKSVTFANDTAWIDIPLASGFVAYSGMTPQYRIKGTCVEVRGAVSPTTAITSSNDRVTFATLPVKPTSDIYELCQGSGKNTWLFSIQPTGEMTVSRYGTTSNAQIPTTAWLVFHAVFLLE